MAWASADAQPTGDPRLDSNPFFEDRLLVLPRQAAIRLAGARVEEAMSYRRFGLL